MRITTSKIPTTYAEVKTWTLATEPKKDYISTVTIIIKHQEVKVISRSISLLWWSQEDYENIPNYSQGSLGHPRLIDIRQSPLGFMQYRRLISTFSVPHRMKSRRQNAKLTSLSTTTLFYLDEDMRRLEPAKERRRGVSDDRISKLAFPSFEYGELVEVTRSPPR